MFVIAFFNNDGYSSAEVKCESSLKYFVPRPCLTASVADYTINFAMMGVSTEEIRLNMTCRRWSQETNFNF